MLFVVGIATAQAGPAAAQDSAADETAAVRAAAAQFYAALNILFTGDVEPMEAVWSHSDDVTYMGPDGTFQVGWTQVLANWESQAAMKLGGEVEPVDMHVTVGQDLAVTHNVEWGTNLPAGGEAQAVSIRATNLFRKEDGAWKMIGHHADRLPFLAKTRK